MSANNKDGVKRRSDTGAPTETFRSVLIVSLILVIFAVLVA